MGENNTSFKGEPMNPFITKKYQGLDKIEAKLAETEDKGKTLLEVVDNLEEQVEKKDEKVTKLEQQVEYFKDDASGMAAELERLEGIEHSVDQFCLVCPEYRGSLCQRCFLYPYLKVGV